MRLSRVFSSIALAGRDELALDERNAHYLFYVLRKRVGDRLVLFDGSGSDFDAEIVRCDRKSVAVRLEGARDIDNESRLHSTLAIAISKGERMDYAVQKATELGVNCIVPLLSERVEVKLSGERLQKKLDHWRQVSIAACEQCGRSRLVQIREACALDQFLLECSSSAPAQHAPGEAQCVFIVLDAGGVSLQAFQSQHQHTGAVALLVGPEGGLTASELSRASAAGFETLRLGPRIMRTETAPVAALAILQGSWGDYL